MGILAHSNLHSRRYATATMAVAMAAAVSLAAPGATSAHATPARAHGAVSAVNCAPTPPWVSTYAFDRDLKVEGGCFTIGGRVYIMVKHNNGTVYYKKWVTARDHPFLAGGWINVNTNLHAPCTGAPNGYARGYDKTTDKWSARFPVSICFLYDDN
ncbi:hypothetical protein ABZY16_04945 [Streptomyces sp. NPDC006553]|uniref:hypothetical protein n=1 Tax=unclassified Streptomyces TaxID=2593676 RepID=UPI00225460D8|nr:hypothetical protein [Streptomyces sp. NBC_00233]MCX5232798.1 hypothetical protein [Streptomyces sp. NBC_00233]